MSVVLPITDNSQEDVAAFNRAADSAAGPEAVPAIGVAGTQLDMIEASRTWTETASGPVSSTRRDSFTSTVPNTEDLRGSARSTPRNSFQGFDSTFPDTYRASIGSFSDTFPDTFPDTIPDTIPENVPVLAMDRDDIPDEQSYDPIESFSSQSSYIPPTIFSPVSTYVPPTAGSIYVPPTAGTLAPPRSGTVRRSMSRRRPSVSAARRRRNKKRSLSRSANRWVGSQRTPGTPQSAHLGRNRRPANWEPDLSSTETIGRNRRPANWEPDLSSTETIGPPRSSSHGISRHASSSSFPTSRFNALQASPTLSQTWSQSASPVSVIDYPNPYRAPLAVLEEMGARSRSRPPARPLGPLVPRNEYRQGRLPFQRVNRRIVHDRFINDPAGRPLQRIPARPMRQWSRLPQYRQIPIEQALNVRHRVVHVSAEEFEYMGFPDVGVAHDVLYQGPGQRDLTRYTRYSDFRRDFERPVVDVPSSSSSQR